MARPCAFNRAPPTWRAAEPAVARALRRERAALYTGLVPTAGPFAWQVRSFVADRGLDLIAHAGGPDGSDDPRDRVALQYLVGLARLGAFGVLIVPTLAALSPNPSEVTDLAIYMHDTCDVLVWSVSEPDACVGSEPGRCAFIAHANASAAPGFSHVAAGAHPMRPVRSPAVA